MSKISTFVDLVLSGDSNSEVKISLGKVPNFKAQFINAKTTINVMGADRILDTYGIKHCVERHGDDKDERKEGKPVFQKRISIYFLKY